MIKALHFIPGYKYGGIETTITNLCKYIDHAEISIDVLVESRKNEQYTNLLKAYNCSVHSIKKLSKLRPFTYYRQICALLQSVGPYDIVNSFDILRTPLFFLAAKKCGIKSRVFHVRTSKTSSKLFTKILYKLLTMLGIGLATSLAACSDIAGDYFFNKRKFTLLKNGIDVNKFIFDSDKREYMRKSLGIGKNTIVIGHVGRFCEAKNHPFIVDIYYTYQQINEDALLLLIGDGPLREGVSKQINDYRLNGKVILTGEVDNVYDYLNAMDILIFPSFYEGFPNIIMEAQTSGLPSFISDTITNSIKVTELVDFLPINMGTDVWVNAICSKHLPITRKNMYGEIVASGYDVTSNAVDISNYYASLLKEGNRRKDEKSY